MTRKERILAFLNEKSYIPLKLDELAVVLDVPKDEMEKFQGLLYEMELDGSVIVTKKGRYIPTEKAGYIMGRYTSSEKQFGFLITDDKSQDIFIPGKYTGGAMHGDTVLVRIIVPAKEPQKAEGEIIKIIKRANQKLVGTFHGSGFNAVVNVDERRIWQLVQVPHGSSMGAADGQKVLIEITEYAQNDGDLQGKVIEILGWPHETATAVLSVMRKHSLPDEFPKEVMREVATVSATISEEEITGRTDLRDKTIFTIDGDDAKDFDDAVSISKLENGSYRLGVHIADVTNYVKEGSQLDDEAFKRATSVYIPGTVVPMLPHKLSNGICSLNPYEDRLTLSCEMDIDAHGNVFNHNVFESVIRSKERMTYNNATKILQGDKEIAEKFTHIVPDLELMQELAEILRKKRRKDGSVDFNFPESKVEFDLQGNPIAITKYDYGISNGIIEEFMLVCNMTIAERYFWLNTPFVYRVHEQPDTEKLIALSKILYNFNLKLKGSIEDIHPKAYQQLMDSIKGVPEERVISTMILRSMMKAKYSSNNAGHFGLAATYYCHFTSPIRRYPDLAIHRIIKEYLKGNVKDAREQQLKTFAQEASINSSAREIIAEDAERDGKKVMMCIVMAKHIGEEFDGIISYVANFGFFVELENTVEGLVRVASIGDDYYDFNQEQFALIGSKTKKIYKIGDSVKIKVTGSNPENMEIDFVLSDNGEGQVRPKRNMNVQSRTEKPTKVKPKLISSKVLKKKKRR